MMGITGILRTSVRVLDLHRPMHTTSLLLSWVMGKIKRLQRGYAVSYCKTVKDCIALADTDVSFVYPQYRYSGLTLCARHMTVTW